MKKINAVLALSLLIFVSGCSLFQKDQDPQVVIQDMISKTLDLSSYGFDASGKITSNNTADSTAVDADIALKGGVSLLKDKTPDVDLLASVKIKTTDSVDGEVSGAINLALKLVAAQIYMQLVDVTLPADIQAKASSFIDLYKGKWYSLPNELLPDEIKKQIETAGTSTDKQEQIKALIKKTQFFDVLENTTEGNNFVYKVKFNTTNLKTFIQEMAKIDGQEVTAEDLAELDKFNDLYQNKITLSINQDTHYLEKIMFALTVDQEGNKFELTLTSQNSEFNTLAAITAPENAEAFNPMSLMGLAMMMEGSQGESLTGTGSIDTNNLGTGSVLNVEQSFPSEVITSTGNLTE